MKTLTKFLLIMVVVFAASAVKAQDVTKVAAKNAKLLEDTLGVRMIKGSWKPGDMMPPHTHPSHEIYVTKGGTLLVDHSVSGGTKDTLNLKSGMHMKSGPEQQHTTTNIGKTNVEVILIEINK